LVFGRNRGIGEWTINYQTEQGKKLFGTGVFSFANGLFWFHASSPGGIFTLRPVNMFDTFWRAGIVARDHHGSVRNTSMAECIS